MPTSILTFAPRSAPSRAVFTKLPWKRTDKAFEPLSCADCAKVEAPWRISTVGQSSSGGGGAPAPSATLVDGVPSRRLLNRSLKEEDGDPVAPAGEGFEPIRAS